MDGADAWTTVDRKASRKERKPRAEEAQPESDGWSQVGGGGRDRRKKDSQGGPPQGRHGGGYRGGDRGKPPHGARGGSSNHRNTLPRKYPGKEQREGSGTGRSQRNTPSPARPAQPNRGWEVRQGNSTEKEGPKPSEAPRKSSWASLVVSKKSPDPAGANEARRSPMPEAVPLPNDEGNAKTTSEVAAQKPPTIDETNEVKSAKTTPAQEAETQEASATVNNQDSSSDKINLNQVPTDKSSAHDEQSTASSELPLARDSTNTSPPDVKESCSISSSPSQLKSEASPSTGVNLVDSVNNDNMNEKTSDSSTSNSNEVVDNKTPNPEESETEGLQMNIDSKLKQSDDKLDVNAIKSDPNGNCVVLDSNKNETSSDDKPSLELGNGTRHYDRHVLLQLQSHPLSLQKPEKLPELEIVLSNPMRSSSSAPILGDLPSHYVHNTFPRPPAPTRRDSRRKESAAAKKIISLSREPVQLHKAENAWAPANKSSGDKDDDLAVLSKKARAILNKLTPQNFEKLVKQFKTLVIDTEAKLIMCMELVFEKAVDEPAFSKAYAAMCQELSMKHVQPEDSAQPVNFRTMLIKKCQAEFLSDYMSEDQRKKYVEDLNKAENEEEEKRIKQEFELLELKLRRRSLGNIRFISELYILQMITLRVMFGIVKKLVTAVDEESLECLCRLLNTSGGRMEKDIESIPPNQRPIAEQQFEDFFTSIKDITEKKKTSSRVRFLLQDVVELRNNKWIGRRTADAGPKKIDEIHKEARREELRIQLADQQRPDPPVARRSEERNRRKTEFRPKPVSDGEWNNVPTKAAKISDVVDPSRLQNLRKMDTDNIKLGPGGGRSMWGAGSSTAPKTVEVPRNQNRFQMFEDIEAGGSGMVAPKYSGRASEPVRNSSQRSSSRSGKPASQASSRDSSAVRSRFVLSGDSSLDEDKVRGKYTTLLEEYISNCDFAETLSSICALVHPKHAEAVVECTLNLGMENEASHREKCGTLLHHLVDTDCLSVVQFTNGIGRVLEFASDFLIDIPMFWDYMADMLGSCFVKSNAAFGVIIEKCCAFLEDKYHRKFVKSTLESIRKLDQKKYNQILSANQTTLAQFLGDEMEALTIQEGTSTAAESTNPPVLMNGSLEDGGSNDELARKLENILRKGLSGNEEMSQIDNVLCDKPMVDKTVRTLVTAVIESAVDGLGGPNTGCSLNKDKLVHRVPILKKYLDAKKEREIFALYAMQSLVHKLEHPIKLLHNIVENLYDHDCISEDAFLGWMVSEDPEEQEGKGVALNSCKQFFEWLKNAEEEDEEQVV